jgi:NitT/TauT family transport system ATP-binding protein
MARSSDEPGMKIITNDLHHAYQRPGRINLHTLQEIDIEVESGEFVAIIGPSGCGKSSLLRVLAGLLEPTQGQALLNGYSPLEASREKQIAWMAQKPALLPWRTVGANVAIAQQINPKNERTLLTTQELLHLVRLDDFSDAHTFTLSGGMQQRVALARTLALGASVWLMDEPFSSLDELTREGMAREVLHLWGKFHPTILWVTHNIYEAVRLADRVLVMSPRPARIQADIPVPMPRPRDDSDTDFQACIRAIRTALAVQS